MPNPTDADADARHFAEHGYLVLRGVLGGDDLAAVRDAARAVQARVRRTLPPGTRYWFGSRGEATVDTDDPQTRALATWGINELPREELFDARLVNVMGHDRIDRTTRLLLGDDCTAWGIKLLWTPKVADYNLRWHRDQAPRELYDHVDTRPAANDHVQYNLALNHDDSFIVVPGSHRRPLTDAEWHAVRHEPTADLPGQVVVDLGPGDVVFMDAIALHRGRNRTTSDRLTLHYSARAAFTGVFPWGEPGHFEWITSDAFIDRLSPATAGYYRRLRDSPRVDHAMRFLLDAARAAGRDGVVA